MHYIQGTDNIVRSKWNNRTSVGVLRSGNLPKTWNRKSPEAPDAESSGVPVFLHDVKGPRSVDKDEGIRNDGAQLSHLDLRKYRSWKIDFTQPCLWPRNGEYTYSLSSFLILNAESFPSHRKMRGREENMTSMRDLRATNIQASSFTTLKDSNPEIRKRLLPLKRSSKNDLPMRIPRKGSMLYGMKLIECKNTITD